MTSPTVMKGAITSMRWRSEPQMPLDVTSMMTSVGSWMTGSGTVSTRTSARPCQVTARMVLSPSFGPSGGLSRAFCPVVTWIALLSIISGALFTLRISAFTKCGTTALLLCGPRHKTAGEYPVAQITNRSRRVYMGPAPLPRSACAMPSNGSQVHEFAPPGPPPRRGIGARSGPPDHRRQGPRNLSPAGRGNGHQHGPDAAPGEVAAHRDRPDHHHAVGVRVDGEHRPWHVGRR